MIEIGCSQCGYASQLDAQPEDLPESLQCPMCGTWLRTQPPPDDAAATMRLEGSGLQEPAPPRVTEVPHLLVTGSGAVESPHPLRKPKAIVGREKADVTIDDPTMSIRHFEIEQREGRYFLRDLGSTNGTRVNGSRVEAAELHPGDRIQAGLTCFVFRTLEAVAWDREA